MKQARLLLASLLAFALAFSCKGPIIDPPEPEPAPALLSCSIENGATFEWNTKSVEVKLTYDQNVKIPTDERSKVTVDNGATIAVNAYNAVVTIKVENLEAGKKFKVDVPAGVVQGFKDNQPSAEAFSISFSLSEAPEPEPDPTEVVELPHNDAYQIMMKLGIGWNMGNHMDSYINWDCDDKGMPVETLWGNPLATQATFDGVKKAGFKSVRIPITWLRKIGPAPDYKIDEEWLSRVEEIVGYAEKAGLNCIINTHHDENHGDDHWQDVLGASKSAAKNEEIKDEIKKFWTQIAERFKDKGDFLIFESFNELNDGGWGYSTEFQKDPSKQCNIINEWNQVFVDCIRATGGNNATRLLGVPGYAAGMTFLDYFKMPDDPAGKTMLAIHCYDPYDYTIGDKQYPEWGHTGLSGKKPTEGEKEIRAAFGKIRNKYILNNIPVYIGEFGCSMRQKSDTRAWKFFLYYLEYVSKAARSYGMPAFLWDNGGEDSGKEQHGYIHHGTGKYIGSSKEAVDAIIKGWSTESPSYTLETVYNNAPK